MLPPKHLEGVVGKVVWAEEHLKTLDREVIDYLKRCRDSVQLPTKINSTRNTVRLTFEPAEEPSLSISLILGDCVHNARSALDHLWKRLGGQGNFPMFSLRDGKDGWLAKRDARLDGIAEDAHALIDTLQPCNRVDDPSGYELTILNKLSNIDKHQAIHLTKPRSANTRFAFRQKGDCREVCTVTIPLVFHDRTEIVLTDVPEGLVKPGMDVNIKGTLFVSFKDAGPWGDEPVQQVLLRCITFIKNSLVTPLVPFTK